MGGHHDDHEPSLSTQSAKMDDGNDNDHVQNHNNNSSNEKSMTIALIGGSHSSHLHNDSIVGSVHLSENEQPPQVHSWHSFLYSHCQPNINEISHHELHSICHKSYEEIKWYLLFIDLIFVSVVYNTEHLISKCGSDHLMVYVMAISYFSLVFTTRHVLDCYASTFVRIKNGTMPLLQNDIAHRLFIVFYGFGIFTMAINIYAEGDSDEPNFGNCQLKLKYTASFAVGFMICRLMIMLWNGMLLLVSNLDAPKTYYRFTLFSRIVNAFIACLLMVPAVTPHYPACVVLFPLIAALCFFEELLRKINISVLRVCAKHIVSRLINGFPKDFPFLHFEVRVKDRVEKAKAEHALGEVFIDFATLVERLGLIFVLVLGEAVIGLSFAQHDRDRTNDGRLTEFSAYILIACYAIQFFEMLDVTTPDLHSVRGGVLLSTLFYVLNILVSFGLLVAIAGLVQLYDHVINNDEEIDSTIDQSSWQMSFGLFLTQVLLILLRFSHKLHLRRSVRRGLKLLQQVKILYQLNFRTRLSRYEVASLTLFLVSAVLHLAVFPICREVCKPYGIISYHAVIATIFSWIYLFLQAVDQRQKEREYSIFQGRRRELIKQTLSNGSAAGNSLQNGILLAHIQHSNSHQ
jgi:hypothetical protein